MMLMVFIFDATMQAQSDTTHALCGTDQLMASYYAANPADLAQRQAQNSLSCPASAAFQPVVVPVIFHYIYSGTNLNESDKEKIRLQVMEQLEQLNADFAGDNSDMLLPPVPAPTILTVFAPDLGHDSHIRFCLASKLPDGSPTEGIIYKNAALPVIGPGSNVAALQTASAPYDVRRFLNCYLIDDINGALGFATYPTATHALDLMCIEKSSFGKGQITMTHEAGHWLNLIHIWGPSANSIDHNCSDDDAVGDTPRQEGPLVGLPTYPTVSCPLPNGNPSDPRGTMFINHMDYTEKRYVFSAGQIARMQQNFQDNTDANCRGLRLEMATNFNAPNYVSCLPEPRLDLPNTTLCQPYTTVAITLTYPRGYDNVSLPQLDFRDLYHPTIPINFIVGAAVTTVVPATAFVPVHTVVTRTITINIDITKTIRVILSNPISANFPTSEGRIRVYTTPDLTTSSTPLSLAQTGAIQTAPNSSIWSWGVVNPAQVSRDVLIPNGVTLNVQDKVLIPVNRKIIVAPGGTLNLLSSGFLTTCNDNVGNANKLWTGVEVQSVAATTGIVTPQRQGKLTAVKGGTIEHAKIGINCANSTTVYGGGGILNIAGAEFVNNQKSISCSDNALISVYDHAMITESHFYTDNNYRATAYPVYIQLIKDKGVTIMSGNLFDEKRTTTTGNLIAVGSRAMGIVSNLSNFHCKTRLTDYPNQFNGLQCAIRAIKGFLGAEDVAIFNNHIITGERGFYLSGFSTPNKLQVVENSFEQVTDYAIYADACTRLRIENNVVQIAQNGIIVRNSGDIDKNVYRNTLFKGNNGVLNHGIVALGVNRSADKTRGLQILCNQFSCGFSNICIEQGNNDLSLSGVRLYQGEPLGTQVTLAGNQFLSGGGPYDILNNMNYKISYYYHTPTPSNTSVFPIHNNETLTFAPPASAPVHFDYATSCKNKYEFGAPIFDPSQNLVVPMTMAWQARNNAAAEKAILQNTLQNLKDGGNTPLTKNEVVMTQLANAYQLYADLMAKSPYLSEEVLGELAEKENFPKALLRDIMVANKHAGKCDDVVEKLESRTDELPEYMMTQIKDASESGLSGKEILENMIVAKEAAYQAAIDQQVLGLTADSTATIADYEAVLSTARGLHNQIALVDAHLYKGNPTDASAVLNSIAARIDLTAADEQDLVDYTALYSVLIAQKAADISIDSLTATQRIILENIAGDDSPAKVMAAAIVSLLIPNPIVADEILPTRCDAAVPQAISRKASPCPSKGGDLLQVSPNPAKDYFTIEVKNLVEEGLLQIYDLRGILVYSTLIDKANQGLTVHTAAWSSGTYFYRYSIADKTLQSGKIEVLK